MKILHAIDIGRKQPKCHIFSGNRIYLRWVDDRLLSLQRIRLEISISGHATGRAIRIGLSRSRVNRSAIFIQAAEETGDARIGPGRMEASCAGLREVPGQFRRRENRSQSGGLLLGKPLSLVANEKEKAVPAVHLGQ